MANGNPDVTQSPNKKGLSPLAWIGIGCAGLAALGAITAIVVGLFVFNKVTEFAEDFRDNPAMATAVMMVKANPDLELVDTDEPNETLTLRHKESGKEVTVDVQDIQRGRITFETPEGEVTLTIEGEGDQGRLTITGEEGRVSIGSATGEDLPRWIPAYPKASVEGAYAASGPEGRSGGFVIKTDASAEDVITFYRERFEDAGFKAAVMTMQAEGTAATLVVTSPDEKRTANIFVVTADGVTQGTITFVQKR